MNWIQRRIEAGSRAGSGVGNRVGSEAGSGVGARGRTVKIKSLQDVDVKGVCKRVGNQDPVSREGGSGGRPGRWVGATGRRMARFKSTSARPDNNPVA